MTLNQAYTEWTAISKENKAQAANNRAAVNSMLLKDLGDMDVRELTAFVVRKHLASIANSCDEIKTMKIRVASILVQVLKYAAGKKACVMPDFDYSIASEDNRPKVLAEPVSQVLGQEGPANAIVAGSPKPASRRRSLDVSSDGADVAGRGVIGGREKIAVVQLHPDTLEVVARFESMADAKRETGCTNIYRALYDHKQSGGYYWCREGEEKDFKPGYKRSPITKTWSRKKKENNRGSRKPSDDKLVSEKVGELAVNAQPESGPRKDADKLARGRDGVMPQDLNEAPSTHTSLSLFSDDELKAELQARGWTGTLYKRLVL